MSTRSPEKRIPLLASPHIYLHPEQEAQQHIDAMLQAAGWTIQTRKTVNLAAAPGVAVREYSIDAGPADNTESRTVLPKISQKGLNGIDFPLCSLEEQHCIVQEVEARLSVCDKMEEAIMENMKHVEALRQSILKQAFEGKLLN